MVVKSNIPKSKNMRQKGDLGGICHLFCKLPGGLLSILLMAAIFAGCNGRSEPHCEAGKVLKEGVCVQKLTCSDTDPVCGDGYKCLADKCVEKNYCEADGDCPGGECRGNRCVLLSRCQDNSECTGEQEYCFGGICQLNSKICELLGCEKSGGVCNASVGKCENAANCAGDDKKCLPGNFCASDNQCHSNRCDQKESCPKGICNKDSGICEDKPVCTGDEDCAGSRQCAKNTESSEGKCRPKEDLCAGIGGCPGNQRCVRAENSWVVSCVEPDQCVTSIDCIGEKRCMYDPDTMVNKCKEDSSSSCRADVKEMNNFSGDAAQLTKKIKNLTLCDDDWFVFDTTTSLNVGGVLVVGVEVDAVDVGVKPVQVEVFKDPTTDAVARASNFHDGQYSTDPISIDYPFSEAQKGLYYIKVSSSADKADKEVKYKLEADAILESIQQTCNNPPELPHQQSIRVESKGAVVKGSCGGKDVGSVHKLTITKRSYVSLRATPEQTNGSEIRPVISIRKFCQLNSSELRPGCSNDAGANQPETLNTVLEPGTYFVSVTFDSDPGNYNLFAEVQPARCTEADNRCEGRFYTRCSPTETHMITEECDSCDSKNKRCQRTTGDTCDYAFTVDPSNPRSTNKINIITNSFKNDFNRANNCNFAKDHASGKDFVHQAEVPDGYVLSAKIESDGNYVAYFTTECDVLDRESCLDHVKHEQGVAYPGIITYTNTTGETQRLFLIVDYNSENNAPTFIKTDVALNPRRCNPGASYCGPGNRESLRCNPFGTGPEETERCLVGCDENTGKCLLKPADRCDTAEEIIFNSDSKPTKITGKLGEMHDLTSDIERGCGDIKNSGGGFKHEAVYKLVTEAKKSYTIQSKKGKYILNTWIATGCNTDSGALLKCLDGTSAPNQPIHITGTGETYYIGISARYEASFNDAGDFEFEVVRNDISNALTRSCNNENNSITHYDIKGIEQTFQCATGCKEDGDVRCSDEDANSCFSAKTLYPDTTDPDKKREELTVHFKATPPEKTTNFLNPNKGYPSLTGKVGACYFETKRRFSPSQKFPQGDDLFYRFVLKEDETLNIRIKGGTDIENTIAFFMSNCVDVNSCSGTVSGVGLGDANQRTLSYQSTKENDIIYLVFKRTDDPAVGSNANVEFNWTIDNLTCAPNSITCSSDQTIKVCNEDGSKETEYTCLHGCKDGVCQPSDTLGDSCSEAIEVTGGGYFYIEPADLSNKNQRINTISCKFSDSSLDGREAFYKVTTTRDSQVIRAKLHNLGGGVPSVYIFSDCENMNETCVNGGVGNSTFTDAATAEVYVPKAGTTYYIGADIEQRSRAPQYLEIDIKEASCSFAEPQCDQGNIKMCKEGKEVSIACPSHTCESSPVRCQTPVGTSCFDALPLQGNKGTLHNESLQSRTTLDSFSQRMATSEIVDGCLLKNLSGTTYLVGTEKYYRIDLAKKDRLHVEISSNISFLRQNKLVLYIMKGCSNNEVCLASSVGPVGNGDGAFAPIDYIAEEAGTYYIVVDSIVSSSTSQTWDLTWKVTQDPESCTGYAGYCDGERLHRCVNGKMVEVTCEAGCEFGKCKLETDKVNLCQTAPLVSNGFAASADLNDSQITNSFNLKPSNICLPGLQTAQKDIFLNVALEPFDTVKTYIYRANPSEVFAIYYTKTCDEIGDTCVAGGTTLSYSDAVLGPFSYMAGAEAETVTVVIDAQSAHSLHPFQFYIDVEKKECIPTALPSNRCDSNTNILTYCNKDAHFKEYSCPSGCNSSNDGCATPAGDTCYDAIPIDFGSQVSTTVNGSFENATNTYNLPLANSCTGLPTEGRDQTYIVTIPAGKRLVAEATSTESPAEDLAIFIASNCNDLPNSCLTFNGDSFGGEDAGAAATEVVEYGPVMEEKVVYLVVDGRFNDNSGRYNLKLQLK